MRETPSDHEDRIRALEDSGGGGGGVTDHGALTGLADDDHTQYHNDTRGDARYSLLAHTHTLAYGTRATLSTTTASLANLATENGTLALAAGYRLLKIDVNKACRVRVYNSSAQRTADASRAIGTDVDIATDHGMVFEYVATALIDAELSPLVDGYCPTGTDAYYAIENRSGSTGTVTVIFTWIRTE